MASPQLGLGARLCDCGMRGSDCALKDSAELSQKEEVNIFFGSFVKEI